MYREHLSQIHSDRPVDTGGGSHGCCWENPLRAEPEMGQSVTIHYDTRSPDENALTEYADSGSAWFAPLNRSNSR